ncbi:MAG: ABC transporter substrate-binding protein [Planctomycetota bacterium]|nr:ABC transporter substrate-binding protein [Planctomycetota bacterium]
MSIQPPLRLLGLLLMLGTIAGGFGCESGAGDAGEKSGPRRLTVQLNWFPEPEFGGLYAALENGHFERHGLQVELIKGGADVPAGQLVASGNTPIAVVSAAQLATLRARGGEATAVFASFQRAPRAVVVRADSPYESLEAVWKGEGKIMADTGLPWVRWLKDRIGETSLQFVPYGGSLAPFISKDVMAMQAFATAEPVQLQADGVATRVYLVADAGYDPYDVVLAVHDGLLRSEPETVARFTAAVRAGWEDYLRDPASINRVIGRLNPDFTAETLKLAASRLPSFVESADTRTHRLGWMSSARWETLLDQLVKIGELDSEEREAIGTIFINPDLEGLEPATSAPGA